MAVPNVIAQLSVDNSCVKEKQPVSFQLVISNTTALPINVIDVSLSGVSQSPGPSAPAGLYRKVLLGGLTQPAISGALTAPPQGITIAAGGSFPLAWSEVLVGAMPVSSLGGAQAVPQAQLVATVLDASGDVVVSNSVAISVYPMMPPNTPPTIPQSSGIGNPPMPVLGQLWFESNLESGLMAVVAGM
jgi:hypothetical protein